MPFINHNAKLFYRIDISKLRHLEGDVLQIISDINSTWEDIEYLNYLFHTNFSKVSDDDKKLSIRFSALIVLSKSFYIYLHIIKKLLEKLPKELSNELIKQNKGLFETIRIARNNIIIHKEKTGFKRPNKSMSATDPKHFLEYEMTTIENEKETTYTLHPLTHIDEMKQLLKNLEKKLLSSK